MEQRIMVLEVKVAFQEATIAELDSVIRTMQDRIDGLAKELRELREQEPQEAADETEAPPHY